jgi:hypothetical protein
MKKLIRSLVLDDGTIEGHEKLNSYITNYCKGLFGAPEEGNLSFDESRTDDIPQVLDEENNLLTAPYSKDEVRKVVFKKKKTRLLILMASRLSSIRTFRMSSS